MLIKSIVTGAPETAEPEAAAREGLDRLRADILAECKAWMEEQLRRARER